MPEAPILLHGDCREQMKLLPEGCIDTVITDPPYGLEFMGKDWDSGVPGQAFWVEALRVIKPGGMLLAFGGTRMYHRLACAIEDAGWEIRDCLMYLYGTGFPKSKNLDGDFKGWGTALKPAWEPIILAMKPCAGTFAENAQKHGVSGLNIDGCRVGNGEDVVTFEREDGDRSRENYRTGTVVGGAKPSGQGRWPANLLLDEEAGAMLDEQTGGASRFFYCSKVSAKERNKGCEDLVLWGDVDLSREMDELLLLARGTSDATLRSLEDTAWNTTWCGSTPTEPSPKVFAFIIETVTRLITALKTSNSSPSSTTRECILGATRTLMGCGSSLAELAEYTNWLIQASTGAGLESPLRAVSALLDVLSRISVKGRRGNGHPTLKPISLMRYLCRLTKTPTGGIVLDPFMGSGSTGVAAALEGRDFIGIEQNEDYYRIACRRIGLGETRERT